MRELREILAAYDALVLRGETAVLASLVHAAGSTYRRPGARMLILPDGSTLGLLSGGCLEGDLATHADRVRGSDQPMRVEYDATAEDDVIWGLGLGCAGRLEILLEPVDAARPGPLPWLAAWRANRTTGAIATSLAAHDLGRRIALDAHGHVEACPPGETDPREESWLREALASGRGSRHTEAERDLVVEIAGPPLRLVVFGAGPDAGPVVRLAVELGWDVEVVDGRPAHAKAESFPGARVHCVPATDAVAATHVDAGSFALVMTHHYLHDREILAALLTGPALYIGLLGPKQRADDLLAELAGQGVVPNEEQRTRLHAPAGLDLGGEGPEAIALSLVSEILAVSAGRSPGWLRDRKGPIHEPHSA